MMKVWRGDVWGGVGWNLTVGKGGFYYGFFFFFLTILEGGNFF